MIVDIKNSGRSRIERSAVTKEDHKPVDAMLDSLVKNLKKYSEGNGKDLSVISKAVYIGRERRAIGSQLIAQFN